MLDIYKNTGGIWDAEILDHIDEMKDVNHQKMQTLHQNYLLDTAPLSPKMESSTPPPRFVPLSSLFLSLSFLSHSSPSLFPLSPSLSLSLSLSLF